MRNFIANLYFVKAAGTGEPVVLCMPFHLGAPPPRMLVTCPWLHLDGMPTQSINEDALEFERYRAFRAEARRSAHDRITVHGLIRVLTMSIAVSTNLLFICFRGDLDLCYDLCCWMNARARLLRKLVRMLERNIARIQLGNRPLANAIEKLKVLSVRSSLRPSGARSELPCVGEGPIGIVKYSFAVDYFTLKSKGQ